MILHCLTDDVKSEDWIEIRNKSKIKRIVVVGISSFGGSLFGVSGKPVDNETRINLTAFNRIFGVKCIINQWFNKLEQFLTVDLTNGNVKGRLIKSFERSKEKDKIARLLLRTDNMPVYGFRVPAYPVKEKLLPDKWVQTTLDSTPINSSNEFLFVGCKTEQHWGHIVIINYEQNVICNEEFKFDGAPPSDYIRRWHKMKSVKDMQTILLSFITKQTKLVGHLLGKYLELLKYAHSNVIDTSALCHGSNGLHSRSGLNFLKSILHKSPLGIVNTAEEKARAILALYKYILERGLYTGKRQESLTHVLNISNRSTAFIDYNGKFQLYGVGSSSNATIALCSNDEEIEEQLLKKIRKPNFVWAHFRDLENIIDPNKYQDGLKKISDRIYRIYNQLSTNSVLMVIGQPQRDEEGIAFIRVKN
ncbi:14676_t:CDS:2 [Entrophospora sp. SA101]|nr:10773_t:CDS:2 [Entrophospora sp. SA101]CAJ0632653.1 9427_t:CDS:2 [Entrophospora sp. SA101]CAJ0750942.1 14676_t:CDS:2 [Entrophospora sp. SA101]CAJ0853039.1 20377_t:CDS:2 [Entrophospora sp. SA101]CAJ0897920.1 9634_t:CDS:2 [Entrophospora sp. SA101]